MSQRTPVESDSFSDDTRAVPAVMSDLLMVGTVVILISVAAFFGLGLSSLVTDSTPRAGFEMTDHNDGYTATAGTGIFELEHTGGDEVAADDTRIVIRDATSGDLVVTLDAENDYSAKSTNVTLNNQTGSFDTANAEVGDTLIINVDAPANQVFESGRSYEIVVIDTITDRPIARGTVEVE